jgi:hypothetical protein
MVDSQPRTERSVLSNQISNHCSSKEGSSITRSSMSIQPGTGYILQAVVLVKHCGTLPS